jgi:hypothetical protein
MTPRLCIPSRIEWSVRRPPGRGAIFNPSRTTSGQIVAAHQGNLEQYTSALQELSHTPACEASNNPEAPYPLDDSVCGQLDVGAAANLLTTAIRAVDSPPLCPSSPRSRRQR